MNNLQNIKNVYFLGIGGIGMSALARYFKHTGRNVAGYDRNSTSLTDELISEGIDVHFEDDIRKIPVSWNPAETLAVFTPAIPDDNRELSWFREKPIGLLKRAKVLGMICNEGSCIAVSGTHGKTTISTMTANIVSRSEMGCGAFLGGISKNFNSNLLLPPDLSSWIVAEADEYDRSFLNLYPQLALISSIDADHLDIYGDRSKIKAAFEKFASQVKPDGALVVKRGIEPFINKIPAKVYTYDMIGNADFHALNIKLDHGTDSYSFDLHTPDGIIVGCRLNYPGIINIENVVGAAGLAFLAGVSADDILEGISEYKGVKRRFDIRYRDEKYLYIDDYAHHPAELKALAISLQKQYPNRKITGIFQPHLYSRTRDFANEFASALDLFDEVVLTPIYAAREEPIPGVSSQLLIDRMIKEEKILVEMEGVPELLKNRDIDLVVTIGAGNINRLDSEIIEILRGS